MGWRMGRNVRGVHAECMSDESFLPPSLLCPFLSGLRATTLVQILITLSGSGQQPSNWSLYPILSCPSVHLTCGPCADLPEI